MNMGHKAVSPDLQRNAAKYAYLVRALDRATDEIKAMEATEGYDLDELLIRLLPDITDALAAEQAFVARLDRAEGEDGQEKLFILAHYPMEATLDERVIPAVGLLHDLLVDGKPRIRTSIGRKDNSFIGGLELFGATATVLVRLETQDQIYIVGVCNERNPENAPFLAADRMTLNYLVETIALNARTSERRQRELEAIKAISEQSAQGVIEKVYATIVQRAVAVTKANYAAIWQYKAGANHLLFRAYHSHDTPLQQTHAGPTRHERAINHHVANERQAWQTKNLASDALYAPVDDETQSVYCVPLKIDQQLLGTLYVAGNNISGLTIDDHQFIDHLAPHAAIALHTAHMQEIRQRVIHFQQRISNVLPLQEQLVQIKEELDQYFHTKGLFIALLDEQSLVVTFPLAYHHGKVAAKMGMVYDSRYRPTYLGSRRGLIELVAEKRQSVLVTDFQQWAEHSALIPACSGLISCLATPLINKGKMVGVIALRSYESDIHFTEYDRLFIEALASHIATVIRNSQQRRTSALLINTAAKAIFSTELEVDQIYQTILAQAISMTGASFGTFHWLQEGALVVVDAWPHQRRQELSSHYGPIPLQQAAIITRAVRENKAQLVTDIRADPDYFKVNEETYAVLAVVLQQHGSEKPIGVLSVEHPMVGGLTEEHKWQLITLANLATLALTQAEQAERLNRSNAVAIMGAWGADIVHDVNREVGSIRRATFILKQQVALSEKARNYLQRIDESMGRLALPELPEALPVPGNRIDARSAPRLVEVVRDELKRLTELTREVQIEEQFHCDNVKVAMHEQWLRRVVRHMVKNGIKAVQQSDIQEKMVQVQVSAEPDHAKIRVIDNGKGVRPEIQPYLFKRPIPHDDQRPHERPGRGLLLVGYIMEAHGGEAKLGWSEPGVGSCFILQIPLIKKET